MIWNILCQLNIKYRYEYKDQIEVLFLDCNELLGII